ncbi:MAG: DUF5979 domain-containing protein [Acidimicrobiia bacterium]
MVLAPGATYSCAFTGAVTGNAGTVHTDTVTASGTDDDNQPVGDTDDATVTVTDVTGGITVLKDANPTTIPEPGGNVTFSVSVHNDSTVDSVTITSLSDDVYGTLAGDADCKVGTILAPSGSCDFTFVGAVSGNAGSTHTDTVTVTGTDDDNQPVTDSDDATVTITDVTGGITVLKDANPTTIPEPGGQVTFTVSVHNDSTVDSVTIDSLVDDVYGTLAGDADCKVGTVLAAGGSCDFTFVGAVSGNAGSTHTDTVTVTGTDDDNQPVGDTDDATVTVTDVTGGITVLKDANPTSIAEPGGNVTFSVSVHNDSTVDSVTITSLSDDVYGTLAGDADCKVGTVLAAGGSCDFTFVGAVSGNAGSTHTDTVTVAGTDDDNQPVGDSDDATVTVTDVTGGITVLKDANPTSIAEPGGNITFTVSVHNDSAVDSVTIDSLVDDVYGTLAGDADCKVGTVLAAGGSCDFTFVGAVSGNAGSTHTDTVTVTGTDDDNQPSPTRRRHRPSPTSRAASSRQPHHREPGGQVTFTVSVHNDARSTRSPSTPTTTSTALPARDGSHRLQRAGRVTSPSSAPRQRQHPHRHRHRGGHRRRQPTRRRLRRRHRDRHRRHGRHHRPQGTPTPPPSLSPAATSRSRCRSTTTRRWTWSRSHRCPMTSTAPCRDADRKVGTVLPPGGSCEFTRRRGRPRQRRYDTDTAAQAGTDDDNQPSANRRRHRDRHRRPAASPSSRTPTTSIAEPGGNVTAGRSTMSTWTVDSVTITRASDDVYGTLAGDADCKVGTVLAAGGSCDFTFVGAVSGNAGSTHTDTVTVTGTDDDNQPVGDTDDATVTVTDVTGGITVLKDANPTSIAEPGGNVTFSVSVTNDSAVDSVTIDSLVDDVYGTLAGDADCQVGTILAPSGSCDFTFTGPVSGNAGSTHTDTVTVTGTDDDNQPVTDTDDATVTITPRPYGSLTITKVFDPLTSGVTRSFAINWSCSNSTSGTVSLSGGQSTTVDNIPTGSVCTVTEPKPTGAPAGWMFGNPVVTGSPATVTSGVSASVTVTNSIIRHTGSVKVVKTVAGAPAGYSATFGVRLTCNGDGGTYDSNITYPTPGSTTITGIPTRNVCDVTEPTLPTAPAGYKWATPTITGGPVTVSLGVVPVVTVANKLEKVAATDTTAPGATFTTPATGNPTLTTNPVVLDGNATDNVGVATVTAAIRDVSSGKYLQANGTWAATSAALPTTLASPGAPNTTWSISRSLPNGSYSIQLTPKDAVGNTPTTKPTRKFQVNVVVADTTAPSATFTTPAAGNPLLKMSPVVLNGDATDNVGVTSVDAAIRDVSSGKYLQANGTWATTYVALPTTLGSPGGTNTTWSISRPLPPGNYSIQLIVKDAAANTPATKPFRQFKVSAP